jgi:phage tail sheath protein FI
MPVTTSYPGVYVQEIPSGVHAIAGVATSITAFLGQTARGPDNVATTINSYGDFERLFGGLWASSNLPYAVRDFFLNGGSQAIIVRLFNTDGGANALPPYAPIKVGAFTFAAASKGAWGSNVRATIDTAVSADVAALYGLTSADLFNLTVREVNASGATVTTEIFRNLTVKDSPARVDKILLAQSKLLNWNGAWPPNPLPAIAASDDDVTKAQTALAAAQAANPQVPATITAAQATLTAALAAVGASDGLPLTLAASFAPNNAQANKQGLYALEQADLFNLLCIPPYTASGDVETALVSAAATYCESRRAFLLVDSPSAWVDKTTAKTQFLATPDVVGTRSPNAAIYFPRLRQPDPLRGNIVGAFAPCGAVAGIFARTDADRGVWKAPAGIQATFANVPDLTVKLTDPENGELNQLGVNCLRAFPVAGAVVWGARTLRGADQLADQNKYIPVRRTTLFIEESLYRGLQWAVFEPNDAPLWAAIRLNVGAFMQTLFRQGAFQGSSPRDAYFVKCDSETTTQADIDLGVVNVIVGFAPLKPAEFVIISIQQIAGQLAS